MTGPRPSAERAVAALRTLGPYLGWICCAAGALLCALGWYGVSGEVYAARQIPYLASATAPGTALIVGGLVLLAGRDRGRDGGPGPERLRRQVAELHGLLTEPAPETAGAGTGAGGAEEALLAVAGGSTYHRADCPLVAGDRDPRPVTPAEAAQRGLRPCPLCDPPAV
ncbi:hypothetical protein [Streptacidiphilus albus]|uniref:hypothetical protein n=1 Tax=Streptacidiphilus albus TaxID=105425 RepID=UPI0005A6781F|nr:hypothetical protein [Streptacidiphilus albus]